MSNNTNSLFRSDLVVSVSFSLVPFSFGSCTCCSVVFHGACVVLCIVVSFGLCCCLVSFVVVVVDGIRSPNIVSLGWIRLACFAADQFARIGSP